MTREISIDLESLSLKADAMILAIGAVEFDRITGLGNTFYRTVDITAAGGGGVIDASTVKWWMNQSPLVQARVFADPDAVPLAQALIDLSEWLGFDESLPEGQYPDIHLWQRGDKDSTWLTSAYEGLNLALPYQYNQISDQRTITNLFPKGFFDYGDSVAHDALSDAMAQAEHLIQAFKRLEPALSHARIGFEATQKLCQIRQDALSTAYACGLETVGEAIENIRLHAGNIYAYEEIAERVQELLTAFNGFDGTELVLDYLLPENKAKVDSDPEILLDPPTCPEAQLLARPYLDPTDDLCFTNEPPPAPVA